MLDIAVSPVRDRQRVCAPLPAFGGPGLPLAARPGADGILGLHNVVELLGTGKARVEDEEASSSWEGEL